MSVLLNTTSSGAGTPTFSGHVEFTTGTNLAGVAIGDLNGDGNADLVVANSGSNSVSMLLNTTAPGALVPSFAAKQDFTTGSKPVSVAIGDLNGDGNRDLVVANANANTVSVLLNTTAPGAATFSFAAKQDFPTGAGPQSVAIKDLNGDGKPDLVVANAGFGANTLSVLLNTTVPGAASPTFAAQQTFATGSGPIAVALGDINGDGAPDLVLANNASGANSVSVLLNTTVMVEATNVSSFPSTMVPASESASILVGDLNGDGKPDIVIAANQGNTVSVLLNTTPPGAITPTFAAPVSFAAGNGTFAAALADLNGDGKLDIVTMNSQDNTVSVLINTTAPGNRHSHFRPQEAFPAGNNERSVSVADVNGDGKPDLIVENYSGYLSVLLNTTAPGAATATFAPQVTFATPGGPVSMTTADLNGDGRPDVVVAEQNSNMVSVLLNTTAPGAITPSFAAPVNFAVGQRPQFIDVADVNGDGKPDLIVASNGVSVLLNTTAPGATTPSFAPSVTVGSASDVLDLKVVDINGDGRPDVVATNYNNGTEQVLLNATTAGSSTLNFTTQAFPSLGRPNGMTAGDLNGDGKPDLVVASQGGNTAAVLLNTPATVGSSTGTATATITETAQFSTGTETVNANAATFSVPVNLSLASPVATTIPFTVGGTAVQGTNYTGVTPSPLVIPAGQTSATITGTLINDGKFNANQTVAFVLSTPTNATLGSTTANTLTIAPSVPAPTVSFATAAQTVNENATAPVVVTVNLSGASDATTTVPFTLGGTAVNGVNYTVNTAIPLVIPPGQTSAAISISPIDDHKYNSVNNTLTLTLGTPTNATVGNLPADTITIVESDPPPTVSFASATQTANENGGTFSIAVKLSAASNAATTVPFTAGGTAVNGTNYSGATSSPLVIPAGQTGGTITGTLIDDGRYDTVNRTLIFTLATPTNATLGATTTDTLTINQSDPPPTVSFAVSAQSANENSGSFNITVVLSGASNVPTTIPFTLGGTAVSGTNYSGVTPSPLIIAAGQTSGTITGTLINLPVFEPGNTTLTITLGAPTNATLGAITTDTLTIMETTPAPDGGLHHRGADRERKRRHVHRHGSAVGAVRRRRQHPVHGERLGGERHQL